MPPDPLALACFACWVCFALHHQKGPLFLEKNLPTLSSAYGPEGVTNFCQISYAPPEILFEITEITRFLKSEIKKIDMVISKIL